MKFNGHLYWLRNIQVYHTGVLSFEKGLFSRSTFQALTKQATKGICIGVFVNGHKVD